jgi:hypothetical protein
MGSRARRLETARRSIAVFFEFPIGTLIAILEPDVSFDDSRSSVTALEVVYVGLEMVDCPPSSSSYGQRVSQTSAGDRVDASTGNNRGACSAIVIAAIFEHGGCSARRGAPYRVRIVRAHDAGST